jgi:hypothetical protein
MYYRKIKQNASLNDRIFSYLVSFFSLKYFFSQIRIESQTDHNVHGMNSFVTSDLLGCLYIVTTFSYTRTVIAVYDAA